MPSAQLRITSDDLAVYHRHYHDRGFFVIPDLAANAQAWASTLLGRSEGAEIFLREDERTVEAGGGYNRHLACDRFDLDDVLPEIGAIYSSLVPILKTIVSPYVIASPYRRSAYYTKVYRAGDQQGWHYDTNTVTGVLYLTTISQSGMTEINTLDGKLVSVPPTANSLLILNGRRCWHRAAPVLESTIPKVVVLMNFFTLGHRLRPPHLDRLIFHGPSATAPEDRRAKQ